ncbi:MAG: M6 family metalloprotease domain-containing protein [Gemmatimonadales bacterium]
MAAAPHPATGQYPRARLGEFEVRGFDFEPNGGWRREAARVMAARQALLHRGAMASLNSGSRPMVKGNFFVPVIPIAFRDVSGPYLPARYQDLFFSADPVGRAWSVKTYYLAASRGNALIDGHVFNWIRVDSSAAYYQDGCNGVGVLAPCPSHSRSRMGELLLAALDSVSNGPGADTVWSRYDNDGPDGIPNSGDDDGVVDVVAFLQPALDGACGAPGIWSHRGYIGLWNNGQPYVTKTPRRDAAGRPIPGQFIQINSYTIQSAVGGDAACDGSQIMPIGTVTHETGHAFGLPDLYDTDPNSATQGAGEWSLMASGTYARPYSPSSFDAWSLVQLGWVTVDTLASGSTHTIGPVQNSDTVYLATTDSPRYYLLENRGNVGTDTAQMNPAFSRAKKPGLLIWLIDDDRVAQGALPVNRVNTGPRQGVALMQADGLNQLRTPFGGNRGDGGDAFPGATGNHDFGIMTFPAAVDWNLAPLDVRIDHIVMQADGSVTFRYVRRAPSLIAAGSPLARIRVDGTPLSSYTEVLAPGDTLNVGADSTQVSFDGRSSAHWLSWSDGGGRDHTVVARTGAPDTLTAAFAIANRLRVIIAGPGSVTSDQADAIGSGTFLDMSAAAHLVAVPSPGAEFVGWRGDTTTAGALDLSMGRPWDLTALFTDSVTVDPAAAARALLGGAPLPSGAASYLDTIGNQNGAYDVGDYLAWLRRNGQHVPPVLDGSVTR